ncbi:MAG TPA: type II toxin-antitoxin system VapC family toxin [Stellaceae bacterium]|jgi:tRNA(fMet)-specific endonuclease VapC|nr:type II toxin-antitoxin system VapC family toxin [Stellaceae bacterium]
MLRYMLHTNICIYIIKNKPAAVRARFNECADELAISTITLAELHFGAENSAKPAQNRQEIEQFLSRLAVLEFSAEAAMHYGQIRAALKRAGRPVGPHDMLIGAHARSASLVLVTNNTREFERIPGLQIENWIS